VSERWRYCDEPAPPKHWWQSAPRLKHRGPVRAISVWHFYYAHPPLIPGVGQPTPYSDPKTDATLLCEECGEYYTATLDGLVSLSELKRRYPGGSAETPVGIDALTPANPADAA
jgi:hypothetical protein